MLSGDVLSRWLQRQTGAVVQGSLISLSRGGLLQISDDADSTPVRPQLPVAHGGQAAVARAQDVTASGSGAVDLALRVQAVTSQEEQSRQMERLVAMLTVATAARERPEAYPAVLPVRESFILTVPGTQIPMTGAAAEYELWCDVMAWCPDDLTGWHRTTGPQDRSPATVAPLVLPVIATVHAVHENLGIIHRDITPNNVLVDTAAGAPRLLLADWGIAHGLAADRTSTYTQLVGNRGFALPPEMLAGDPSVGRYTDAWYLGCLLSWMLTADTPGPQHGAGWLPSGLVDGTVRAVVAGLCAPDPRQRLALPDAITALREGRAPASTASFTAPYAGGPSAPTLPYRPGQSYQTGQPYQPGGTAAWGSWQPGPTGTAGSVTDAPGRSSRGRRALVVTAVVAVVCLVVGGAVWGVWGLANLAQRSLKQDPAARSTPRTTQSGHGSGTNADPPGSGTSTSTADYVVWDRGTDAFTWGEDTFPPVYVFTSPDELPRQITCTTAPMTALDFRQTTLAADLDVTLDYATGCPTNTLLLSPDQNWTVDWTGTGSGELQVAPGVADPAGQTVKAGTQTVSHVVTPGKPTLHLKVTSAAVVHVEPQLAVY